jgi:hypothetical protein
MRKDLSEFDHEFDFELDVSFEEFIQYEDDNLLF